MGNGRNLIEDILDRSFMDRGRRENCVVIILFVVLNNLFTAVGIGEKVFLLDTKKKLDVVTYPFSYRIGVHYYLYRHQNDTDQKTVMKKACRLSAENYCVPVNNYHVLDCTDKKVIF